MPFFKNKQRNNIPENDIMDPELLKQALEKVGNPGVLVNLISRRVRQLNNGGGGISRPLMSGTGNLGVADIALREIIEERMGWEMPEVVPLTRPRKKTRRGKGFADEQT